jgi:hypothetical protein
LGIIFRIFVIMKRYTLILALTVLCAPVLAQQYEPRETWPFIYEEFQPGATRTLDGSLVTEARFNVAVHDGTLMFIGSDGVIMRPDMARIYTARVGDDVYVNIMGRMYRVLAETSCGNVVLGTEIDVDKQNQVNIGYGISSSTASSYNMSVLMDGRFDIGGKNLQQTEQDKYRGEVLPVKQTYYLHIGTRLIPASRQEILSLPGMDKKAANAFFKQEKIKWKDTASLEKVVVFVNEQLNK